MNKSKINFKMLILSFIILQLGLIFFIVESLYIFGCIILIFSSIILIVLLILIKFDPFKEMPKNKIFTNRNITLKLFLILFIITSSMMQFILYTKIAGSKFHYFEISFFYVIKLFFASALSIVIFMNTYLANKNKK